VLHVYDKQKTALVDDTSDLINTRRFVSGPETIYSCDQVTWIIHSGGFLIFSLPKKIRFKKNQCFCDQSSSFCSTYPNICDRTKRIRISSLILMLYSNLQSKPLRVYNNSHNTYITTILTTGLSLDEVYIIPRVSTLWSQKTSIPQIVRLLSPLFKMG
jgi:hypothetical protein